MQLSFFQPSSVRSLKAGDERAVTSVVAFFSSRYLVIFLMSLLASVTVCLVDGGGIQKPYLPFWLPP